MTSTTRHPHCIQLEHIAAYALGALPPAETTSIEAHLASCAACQVELELLAPLVATLRSGPLDVLQPSPGLWDRLAMKVAPETGMTALPAEAQSEEPAWEDVAPGISCKLLSTDVANSRVSMMVRLQPGAAYPPHVHAGLEELHLLDGELWINNRLLVAGDYNRAEAGSADYRVWSRTGCTCVLITSTRDRLTG